MFLYYSVVSPSWQMTAKTRLPPELVDQIIDHLWDNQKALLACSLTCRTWVPSSRLHLFRSVRVCSAADCTTLSALISSAPVITRCIQKFTVSADFSGTDGSEREEEGSDTWINAVAVLVAKLERVHTLALSRLRWDVLSPGTKYAFATVFKNVKTLLLFEVRFHQSADVIRFLSAFPQLAELYFHGVSWTHESLDPFSEEQSNSELLTRNTEHMQLTYLFLDPQSSPTLVTEWLLKHPVEPRLRTIELCWREMEDARALGDLLRASGSTLERLQIEFPAGLSKEGEVPCSSWGDL